MINRVSTIQSQSERCTLLLSFYECNYLYMLRLGVYGIYCLIRINSNDRLTFRDSFYIRDCHYLVPIILFPVRTRWHILVPGFAGDHFSVLIVPFFLTDPPIISELCGMQQFSVFVVIVGSAILVTVFPQFRTLYLSIWKYINTIPVQHAIFACFYQIKY